MKLSDMRELLAREEIQLTKSLGQNFLHDGNQLRRIVKAAELSKQDKVLEIGPGLGPLTELLLESAGEVLAIEKDARLIELLKRRFAHILPSGAPEPEHGSVSRSNMANQHGKSPSGAGATSPSPIGWETAGFRDEKSETGGTPVLRLFHADALEHLKHEPRDWSQWKLAANLPYSVASPILVELAQGQRSPRRLVATLQWEVARRLMAQAGDEDFGILSLLIQLDFEPRDSFRIPASCFFPQPDVDSACVVLDRRPQPLLPENLRNSFRAIVKQAFSQRRKMMFKLLKQDWPKDRLLEAFDQAGMSAQTRAESVSLSQFVTLTSILR